MRGGTLCFNNRTFSEKGLSPHARGNPVDDQRIGDLAGPIPACAGEPDDVGPLIDQGGAYPRMRGGTACPATPS